MEENAYEFTIRGCFGNVSQKNIEIVDASGNVVGFQLPDGRMAQLVMALEVVSADGTKAEYVTKEEEMEKLGFDILEYASLTFNKE